MLLGILVSILLIRQGVEAHLVDSSNPYQQKTHQPNNIRLNDAPSILQNMQDKHSLKHFTPDRKQNVVQYQKSWQQQLKIQKQLSTMHLQNSQAGVKEIMEVNGHLKQQIVDRSKQQTENDNIYKNNNDYDANLDHNNFENHIYQDNSVLMKEKSLEQANMASLHHQQQSQFIDNEEKTLFRTFIDAINQLVTFFSNPQHPNQNDISINEADHLEKVDQNVIVKEFSSEVQSNNQISQSFELPKEILSSNINKYELEASQKMINDTKLMAKTRKKLYFIICTLSFGATCIFLIKLFEKDQDKKIIYRKVQKIKIPTEDFYIQQI